MAARTGAADPGNGSSKPQPGDERVRKGVADDEEDMAYLTRLMDSVRTCAQQAKFNRAQCKLLSDRCGGIHRTLNMMKYTNPTPNVLSAFRSAEYLVRRHVSAGWEGMLVQRFTATDLFESARQKIKLVWSLQSTTRWEQEDAEAAEADARANLSLLRALGLLPVITYVDPHTGQPRLATDDERVLGYYARRQISGWKLPFAEITLTTLAPVATSETVTGAPNVEDPLTPFVFHRSDRHRTHHLSWNGSVVSCLELERPESITANTLERFVIDQKCRHTWCHPVLVPCLGGFAEKFDEEGTPRISLGAVIEDLTAKGFVSLDELLYQRGRRLSLATCLKVVLEVADALQYAIFSSEDVVPEVADAWALVTPSNVYLRFAKDMETAPSPGSPPQLQHWPGENECTVRFLPGFYVEDGPINRWLPPRDAVNKHCYSLTQLLIAMLVNGHPFPADETQEQLSHRRPLAASFEARSLHWSASARSFRRSGRVALPPTKLHPLDAEPDGMNAPKSLPAVVQDFIHTGLKHHMHRGGDAHHEAAGPPPHRGFSGTLLLYATKLALIGTNMEVAGDEDLPPGFVSIQHFRRGLTKILRSDIVQSLPTTGAPTSPSSPLYADFGPIESNLTDYGTVLDANASNAVYEEMDEEPIPFEV